MLCSQHLLCLLHIVISSYPRWHQMSTKAQNTIILSSVTSCHLIEYWLVWPQAQIILVDHVYFFVMVFHLYKTKIGLKFTFLQFFWYLQTWMLGRWVQSSQAHPGLCSLASPSSASDSRAQTWGRQNVLPFRRHNCKCCCSLQKHMEQNSFAGFSEIFEHILNQCLGKFHHTGKLP